jgi:predicted nucleic acid-binding Zn ribbon protein
MRTLQDLLAKKVARKAGQSVEIDEKTVIYAADKVISALYGERGVFNIRPQTYQGKKLTIGAKSSRWVNEIHLMRDELIQKTNDFLGQEAVTALVVFLKP